MNKINKINVCCQKVLPLVYDESLSYYEVLSKVIQKLNELIKINNNIRDGIHKEYVEILEAVKTVTETLASVTSMRDEVLSLKQATEQYANDVVTVYNQTVQARDTAIAKAESAEQSASTASAKANIAQASATTATNKADIAVQSANTATQSATSAQQNANSASQSATTATEKANEAKHYADEAKASADLVGQDVTQLKQDVTNLQTSVNKNTSDISSLNTKVTTNTSNISSLTTKVNNNTSDISSLTTKVNNNTSQITTLNSMLAVYWKTLYPIGSIYISTNSNFNPQTSWGGTWVKTADGRCLIGANSTYPLGSTGGSATHSHSTKDHTLTTEELPAHAHPFSRPAWTNDEYVSGSRYLCSYGYSNASTEIIGNTKTTGGDKPHNHGNTNESSSMQPYLAVYIWERTA